MKMSHKVVFVKLIIISALFMKSNCKVNLGESESCFDATNETKLAKSKCAQHVAEFSRGANFTTELRCRMFINFFDCLQQVLKTCEDQKAANDLRNDYNTELKRMGCEEIRNSMALTTTTTTATTTTNAPSVTYSTEETTIITETDADILATTETYVIISAKIENGNESENTSSEGTRANNFIPAFLFCSFVALCSKAIELLLLHY